MLEANVPAKVVQDVLGHADVTLTLNTYSHVIGSTAHEQMAKINNLFQANEPVKPEAPPKESIKSSLTRRSENPNRLQSKPQNPRRKRMLPNSDSNCGAHTNFFVPYPLS
jgi:hypothetical protein